MRAIQYVLILLLATASFAQSSALAAREEAGKAVADPSLTGTAAQPNSQLSLVSSNEGDTVVKAEIGRTLETKQVDWNYGLRVQGPLNKGGGDTKLAGLSGLGSGSTAGLHVTRVGYGRHFDPDAVAPFCAAYDKDHLPPMPRVNVDTECTLEGIQTKINQWPESQRKNVQEAFDSAVKAAAITVCENYNKSGAGPLILCDKTEAIRSDLRGAGGEWPQKLEEETTKALPAFCERLNTDADLWGFLGGADGCDTDDVARVGEKELADLNRKIKLQLTMFSLGVDIQNQSFKFAPGTTLEETKETHQNLSFSGSFGRYFVGPQWYVSVSAAVERVFEGGTPQQVCSPISDTSLTTCKTIARTAPTRDDNQIVTLEARKYITDNIAIQPRFSRDLSDDVSAAELIVYLFKDKDKGLNGGVNLGYRDDEDDPTLTVFIGVPFDLFGGD